LYQREDVYYFRRNDELGALFMRVVILVELFLFSAGCSSHTSLSPAQLIGDSEADVAVQEFLMSSRALAYAHGLEFKFKSDVPIPLASRSRVNRDLFGFPIREEVAYSVSLTDAGPPFGPDFTPSNARAQYIKAGAYASMILCRNYLSGLRDRNEYFEFLQKELNIAGGLANIAMQLSHANGTIRTSVTEGMLAVNQGFDVYESFRFLSPEIETILPIVTNAQITLRDYYLKAGNGPTTFSGAMNAVSQIEYQCTRSGIRGLLNKALVQGAPQFKVINGILYATAPKTEEKPTEPGNGKPSADTAPRTPATAAAQAKSKDTKSP
jgi:hypothetical protein